jgi:hypothetical protein
MRKKWRCIEAHMGNWSPSCHVFSISASYVGSMAVRGATLLKEKIGWCVVKIGK